MYFLSLLQHFGAGRSTCLSSNPHFPWNLQNVGAICSIFPSLEAAVSTVFAAFLNSNLSFSMEFATFWRVNSSWKMVVCNKGSFRVGFKISLGFLYGLNLGVLSVGFRVRVWLGSI